MATNPLFVGTPVVGSAQLSVANTNRDGTGTIVTVLTAGTSGTRVEHVRIRATGTTTAGVIRLYIHDGTTARLYEEILVSAVTPSTTTASFTYQWTAPAPFILPATYSLRASTHNAEAFNIVAMGGNF